MHTSEKFHSICDRVAALRVTFPNSVALEHKDQVLTYLELDQRSDRFAGYLSSLGLDGTAAVAICMERSIDWVVAALGAMKFGVPYVPLEPTWPDARMQAVLDDSGATALVGPSAIVDRFRSKVHGIDMSGHASAIEAAALFERCSLSRDSLAYIIYTSGSTGAPKGVEITHDNLSHLIKWHLRAFDVTSADRASHLAGLAFDAAVWEIWPGLCAGATLCIPDESTRFSPKLIQDWLLSQRITMAFVPTIHAATLITSCWPATTKLRFLLTGGDTLHHFPAASLPFTVVNSYGPTECTVVATCSFLLSAGEGRPPIGLPVDGTQVYLLDDHGQQVADGEVGEIYIGGRMVGRGYRNMPEATRTSFLADPFAGSIGARMYRTGDRGSRLGDGQLEFHGRLDRQVKIRGQRIELDEISSRLNQHPGLDFGWVTAPEHFGKGINTLAAYICSREGAHPPTGAELQQYLLGYLPSYMVPTKFMYLDKVPLTSSGKLDQTMLPPLDSDEIHRIEGSVRSSLVETEDRVLQLVREILGTDLISATDNFFLWGGNSLFGMQLIARVQKELAVTLTSNALFYMPTARNLAPEIERLLTLKRVSSIWSDLLAIQHIERDRSFDELGGNDAFVARLKQRINAEFDLHVPTSFLLENNTINKQATHLHERLIQPALSRSQAEDAALRPIFWLHYSALHLADRVGLDYRLQHLRLAEEELPSLGREPSLQKIAACLLRQLVAIQPHGPYMLGGFCLGGLLSYEIACQLQAAGHEVSLLILVDTPSPEHYRSSRLTPLIKRPAYVATRVKQLGARKALARASDQFLRLLPIKEPGYHSVQASTERAAGRYEPQAFAGKVAMILAKDILSPNAPSPSALLSWWQSYIAEELHAEYVDCSHLDLFKEPAVQTLAKLINSRLAAVKDAARPIEIESVMQATVMMPTSLSEIVS